ncbi:MAG: glucose-6-phosphate isomerase family protein [Trueperaceae bacterium]
MTVQVLQGASFTPMAWNDSYSLNNMIPLHRTLELSSGQFTNADFTQTRRLSDLEGLFYDREAEAALLLENPTLYQVFLAHESPAEHGQLSFSTTIIYPGKVGDEYFMTKGHFHARGECAELYTCLQGEGMLLQSKTGEVKTIRMAPGVAAYIPPYWGHRTMNIGRENFAFYACYPAEAGYDYETIINHGFASVVVEKNGKAEVIANPRYRL